MDVATPTHRFMTVDSTPTAIGAAVKQHVSIDPTQTQVVFETCDTCGWVHDEVAPLGVNIVMRQGILKFEDNLTTRRGPVQSIGWFSGGRIALHAL
jgi:hypothetical protein